MSIEGEDRVVFNRHTIRSDGELGLGAGVELSDQASELYPSITNAGVERAQERALTFENELEAAPDGTVLFIGGASEEPRTLATAEVIGDTLSERLSSRNDVGVLTKKQLQGMVDEGETKALNIVKGVLAEADEKKKLVFSYPLFLKELSLRPHQRLETGEHSEFMKALLAKTGNNERDAIEEWFKVDGKLEAEDGRILENPGPQELAEVQIQAISRLRDFARTFIQDRPLIVGFVGHGWQLDALAVYLTNNGVVNYESFIELFGDEQLQQPEGGEIHITGNEATFHFRGEEYEIPTNKLSQSTG